jgi:hypothetical protein
MPFVYASRQVSQRVSGSPNRNNLTSVICIIAVRDPFREVVGGGIGKRHATMLPQRRKETGHEFHELHRSTSICEIRANSWLSLLRYTTLSFHLPRLKSRAEVTARMENDIVIAQNTPCGPQPKRFASKYASGISNNQEDEKIKVRRCPRITLHH